jgi:hypothetical protein
MDEQNKTKTLLRKYKLLKIQREVLTVTWRKRHQLQRNNSHTIFSRILMENKSYFPNAFEA